MENNVQNPGEQRRVEPKDVFMHLLAMVTLYASAAAFLTIAFQYINVIFFDSLEPYRYALFGAKSAIRFAIATLVVVFPVYFFTTRHLNGLYVREPEKRSLKIRKWFVYFTLFIAALVIIGDLVSVVNNFLQGELTIQFMLKVVAVLFVAGSIFGYYLLDVRNRVSRALPYFRYGIPIVVLVVLVLGFIAAGSPAEERRRRADEQRVNDLSYIQSNVITYWQNKAMLPTDLEVLNDVTRGVTTPHDPKTSESYRYKIINAEDLKFQLCAVFETDTSDETGSVSTPAYVYDREIMQWEHSVGEYCFERSIDRDFYSTSSTTRIPKELPARF